MMPLEDEVVASRSDSTPTTDAGVRSMFNIHGSVEYSSTAGKVCEPKNGFYRIAAHIDSEEGRQITVE